MRICAEDNLVEADCPTGRHV